MRGTSVTQVVKLKDGRLVFFKSHVCLVLEDLPNVALASEPKSSIDVSHPPFYILFLFLVLNIVMNDDILISALGRRDMPSKNDENFCVLRVAWPTTYMAGVLGLGVWYPGPQTQHKSLAFRLFHLRIRISKRPPVQTKKRPVTNLPHSSQPPPKTSPTSSSTPLSPVPSPHPQASNTKKGGD